MNCTSRNSPQPIFQFDSAVGFLVTIFHDDRSVEREGPFVGGALFHGARSYCARSGYDYGTLGNFEWSVGGCAVDFASHKIVNRRGAGQDGPRSEDSAGAHQG